IQKQKNGSYKIITDKNEIIAEKVVIATGGKAAAAFGTTGDGYKLATNLEHKVNKVIPALVPIECKNEELGVLSGVRAKGKVT
ncbi:NAD(P)/FAD-dependent oxidoreductase, partial [Acinetobacter baumannii]